MYEGSLCVCCMSTEHLFELFQDTVVDDNVVNYSKMLSMVLNIPVSETEGHDSICKNCILKLKDCILFKRMALKCMSILSSNDVLKLINFEDIEILGVTNSDLTVTEVDEVRINESNAVSSDVSDENEEAKEIVKTKVKRPVGRPRTRPPDNIPYKIDDNEFICRECNKEFPSNVTLKIHYNLHFGQHICKTCKKKFMTYQSLKKHENSHLQGPFICNHCGQKFRNINTLSSHKRYKHGSRNPYPCKCCGKGFATLQQRFRHLFTAHAINEKRYMCTYCEKKFRNASERSKHIANKHEVKWFPCPICGLRYRQVALRAHLRRHTAPATPCHIKDFRRFVCKLCSKEFTQKVTLKYHIGSHVRKGEYRGDEEYLIVDKKYHHAKDKGLLMDETPLHEEYLDEESLSLNVEDLDVKSIKSDQLDFNNLSILNSDMGFPSDFDD